MYKKAIKFHKAGKYLAIIFLITVIILSIIDYIKEQQEKEEILKNQAFTVGEIIEVGHMSIASHYLVYTYKVNNKIFEKHQPADDLPCLSFNNDKNCIGLKYWVMYSKINPEKSVLLYARFLYDNYHLKALKEIKPLFVNNPPKTGRVIELLFFGASVNAR